MPSPPLVSVVVPTYNRSHMLREAIGSVRAQTHEPWELIVVDDGSTDDTPDLLAGFDDQRLRVIRLAHTGNTAWVRNAGLAECRGQYVAFLDDDDHWMPTKLAVQVTGLERSGRRWGYTAFTRMDEHGGPVHDARVAPWRPHAGEILEHVLRIEAVIPLPTVMAERALLEEVGGFDETLRFCEDYDLWFRIAARAAIHVEETPLTSVRVHARHKQADRAGVHAAWVRVYRKAARMQRDPRLAVVCRRQAAEHAVTCAALAAQRGRRIKGVVLLAGPGRGLATTAPWWKTLARVALPGWLVNGLRHLYRRRS